jgi:NAD(P)-dependent dehydrogenase (short-subunit alcohol dehydrogenase family)
VRINELQPGVIETPMIEGPGWLSDQLATSVPMGRIGRPCDIATVVAFLLLDETSYVTGAHVAVDSDLLV